MAPIPTTICGIPCLVRVDRYHHQPPFRGSPWQCDSDLDFYGYSELEWSVLDRNGRPAGWLARKLTAAEAERIEREIASSMEAN